MKERTKMNICDYVILLVVDKIKNDIYYQDTNSTNTNSLLVTLFLNT